MLAHLHTTPNRYVGMPYTQCGVFRRCAYTQELLPPVFFSERLFSLFSLPYSRGPCFAPCHDVRLPTHHPARVRMMTMMSGIPAVARAWQRSCLESFERWRQKD